MMKSFPLNSRAQTTSLKQPKELFSFARDIDGKYVYDPTTVKNEHVSYYYLPETEVDKHIDLGAGYQNFKKIPENENLGDFDALLRAIMLHEKQTGEKVASDIVSFRGLMTKILTLPYNMKDRFDLQVVSYDGQIFIKNNDEIELKRREGEAHQRQQQQQPHQPKDFQQRCEFSGYKFETIATLAKPWADSTRASIEKRGRKVVNNYEQHISVVRTGIGKVRVLLAGEVDCVWDYLPETGDPLAHYAELKTSRVLEHPGQVVTFEKKLFKTWAQCFLLGVRKVVYGFRDDNLILQAVEVYQTEEIPLMLKNNPLTEANSSSQKIVPMNALKWYGAVLEWLLQEIPRDAGNGGAWKLSFDPGSRSFNLTEVPDVKQAREEMISAEFREWRVQLRG